MDDTGIERTLNTSEEERDADPATPAIGKWYWFNDDDEDDDDKPVRRLCCVTHIGSNYVNLEGPSDESGWHRRGDEWRVHFNKFWDECEYEPNGPLEVRKKIDERQREFNRLMGRVKMICARLGVTPSPELTEGEHTQALATRNGEPIPQYREALIKAKDEELPKLFKEMKNEAEIMAGWMQAETLPLEGQKKTLETSLGKVNRRILAVDLYAGLSEEAKLVRKGKAADIGEPLYLIQRRCYMDEECLAQYETGGMEFKDIKAFDRWLAKKKNMDRLLPFPRCMVAFRVRREDKRREIVTISDFINLSYELRMDKSTFLYIRNGKQLWRISTAIDFGSKLFPDFDRQVMDSGQKLWADDGMLITDNEYQAMVKSERRAQRKKDKENKEWDALTDEERASDEHVWPGSYVEKRAHCYIPFVKENVYYDDIAQKVSDSIEDHNRIATIIQGILDRSPVLNPHPPWKIWTAEGFNQALKLIYDQDRALVAGAKPDFEAYRDRLNVSIKTGSVTIGQQRLWMKKEAEKECKRMHRNWRTSRDAHYPELFEPLGNPGPGVLAKVVRFQPRAKNCVYHWERERAYDSYSWHRPKSDTIKATFMCSAAKLFNVDAYEPGDFHQFFDDPRTRAEYLEWAPFLLTAEEYHAGNRKVGPEE